MSSIDYRSKRLNKTEACKLIVEIANRYPENIRFSAHALEQLKARALTTSDVFNVLKSPHARILSDAEFENGSFRYRLETSNIMVVIAFVSKTSFVVVTAWRK